MKLESLDGRYVELTVSGYEFAGGPSTPDEPDWDANWLMIAGKVWDGDQSWAFHDPCMTTWEAQQLASWLRGLGNAHPATVESADPEELRLYMTEPNVMFELNRTSEGITTLDVFFDAESQPPSGLNDEGLGHRVRLTMPQADVAAAANEWERELMSYPIR